MASFGLLEWLLTVELVLVAGILAAYFGLGALRAYRERRDAPAVARGERIMRMVAAGEPALPADVYFLHSLRTRLQIRLFADLAIRLTGQSRDRLTALATKLDLSASAAALCQSRRWYRRVHGIRLFKLMGEGEHIVSPLMMDRRYAVRAEAVDWAGENPSDDVIARLVELLAQPEFVGGYVLRDALLRIGAPALPRLTRYLDTHHGEEAIAALDVALGMPGSMVVPAALRLTGDPSPRVRSRAATLLGAAGGGDAIARLLTLLTDPDPRCTGRCFRRARAPECVVGRAAHRNAPAQ